MPAVCLYLQVHQPYRLRHYSVFDAGPAYFDRTRNREILRNVAQRCYLPVARLLKRQIEETGGAFRLAVSLTGAVLEQMQDDTPEVIDAFRDLAQTGGVEFLAETYHHSLASLFSDDEFHEQIQLHLDIIEQLFAQRPRIFRNTELIHSDRIAQLVAEAGDFRGILVEGVDALLEGRSRNRLYHAPDHPDLALLPKNYQLSDDIAFRFSNRDWSAYPLTAEKYASWIRRVPERDPDAEVCQIFMDMETFGEHQRRETGIFEFLDHFPRHVLRGGQSFVTPSEAIDTFKTHGPYSAPQVTSWADTERDASAWIGNAMQSSALRELTELEAAVKASGDDSAMTDWRRLTGSDHFYYMSTKHFADGAVHKYFSPYESPYDSYINFMNVLDNLRTRLKPVTA